MMLSFWSNFWHTPNEGDPGHRLGELQPDLPDVSFLITTPDSKNLCNVALHKLFGVSCLVLDPLLLLCAYGRQATACKHGLWVPAGIIGTC